jgi:hypothetical protein
LLLQEECPDVGQEQARVEEVEPLDVPDPLLDKPPLVDFEAALCGLACGAPFSVTWNMAVAEKRPRIPTCLIATSRWPRCYGGGGVNGRRGPGGRESRAVRMVQHFQRGDLTG